MNFNFRFTYFIASIALGASMNTSALPNISEEFDLSPFSPLDLQEHCQTAYGSSAGYMYTSNFALDAVCVVDNNEHPLTLESFQAACDSQYGQNTNAVLLDVTPDSWFCADWSKASNKITSAILIAKDKLSNLGEATQGIENIASSMEATRSWYADQLDNGKSFQLVHPITIISDYSAYEWQEFSCRTSVIAERPSACDASFAEYDNTRYLLSNKAREEVVGSFSGAYDNSTLIKSSIFIYIGTNANDFGLGAAGDVVGPEYTHGVFFNIQPPSVATCDGTDPYCGVYAIGHEMGHNFGLGHTCGVLNYADCYDSIMEGGSYIPNKILFDEEKSLVQNSSFFNLTPSDNKPLDQLSFFSDIQMAIGETTSIDLASAFSDPDGDFVFPVGWSGNSGIAKARADKGELTIDAVAAGTVDIHVKATDGEFVIFDKFTVTISAGDINNAPEIAQGIENIVLTQGDASQLIDLKTVFSDPDNDSLAFYLEGSNSESLNAKLENSDYLRISAKEVGTETFEIIASDGWLDVTEVFTVTVKASQNEQPCAGVNVYPNWTAKDWEGGNYNHANAGDKMVHQGVLYQANWYTTTVPGGDLSWSNLGACD